MRARAPAAVLAAALLLAAAGGSGAASADPRATAAAQPRLKAFRSCAELVRYGRRHARRVGTNAVPPFAPGGGDGRAPGTQGAPEGAAPVAGEDFSGTNVQEAGIDEPDLVKTNGRHIFAVAGGRLNAVEAGGGAPRVVGSLELGGFGGELLLRGDRILVFGQSGGVVPFAGAASIAPDYRQETTLTEVDVRNPSAMRVLRTLTVDGNYVTARERRGTARVVFVSAPRALDPPPPGPGPEPAPPTPAPGTETSPGGPSARASGSRRAADWRPSAVLEDRRTRRRTRRSLSRCRAIRRPEVFSGLDMVTVLTIDLDRGLPAIDSDAIMAGAETVYASDRNLYVATQRYIPPDTPADRVPRGTTTQIHRFAASESDRTDYRASGQVLGFVLNQFSLSEHRGFLRVATTEQPSGFPGETQRESESFVTVLDEREGALVRVGRADGLGRGERIYAVRFVGDVGYVVTFRQVDPLYTLDLSDPERPRVRGELKILGFSAYLHPVSDDLLLGIGQDATDEGRVRGTQLSLFDVSDIADPRRLHQRALGDSSSSEVEYDHRAFLWWPRTKLAVLPVAIHSGGFEGRSPAPPFIGAIGFRVDRGAGIDERGRVAHDGSESSAPITRSLVIGDTLFTVSDSGVRASALDDFADRGFAQFPQPTPPPPQPEPQPAR